MANPPVSGQGIVNRKVGPSGYAGYGLDTLPFEEGDDDVCA